MAVFTLTQSRGFIGSPATLDAISLPNDLIAPAFTAETEPYPIPTLEQLNVGGRVNLRAIGFFTLTISALDNTEVRLNGVKIFDVATAAVGNFATPAFAVEPGDLLTLFFDNLTNAAGVGISQIRWLIQLDNV